MRKKNDHKRQKSFQTSTFNGIQKIVGLKIQDEYMNDGHDDDDDDDDSNIPEIIRVMNEYE